MYAKRNNYFLETQLWVPPQGSGHRVSNGAVAQVCLRSKPPWVLQQLRYPSLRMHFWNRHAQKLTEFHPEGSPREGVKTGHLQKSGGRASQAERTTEVTNEHGPTASQQTPSKHSYASAPVARETGLSPAVVSPCVCSKTSFSAVRVLCSPPASPPVPGVGFPRPLEPVCPTWCVAHTTMVNHWPPDQVL